MRGLDMLAIDSLLLWLLVGIALLFLVDMYLPRRGGKPSVDREQSSSRFPFWSLFWGPAILQWLQPRRSGNRKASHRRELVLVVMLCVLMALVVMFKPGQ